MIFPSDKVARSLHYIPGSGLLYVNNAKVACSSIKKSLWTWKSPETFTNPHDRARSPFCTSLHDLLKVAPEIAKASAFTVVRNPYSRILSAYLDKTTATDGGKRDLAVWSPLKRRFGFDDNTPDLKTFLEVITTEEPGVLDQHFCPQYENVLFPLVSYSFIGRLEEMDDVWAYLSKWSIHPEDHRPHSTQAQKSLTEIFGPEEQKLMLEYFEDDFEAFGYSHDPAILAPVKDVKSSGAKSTTIVKFLQAYGASNPGGRRAALSELLENVSGMDHEYHLLETSLMPRREFNDLVLNLNSNSTLSWPTLTLIAKELLDQHRLDEAKSVIEIATKKMKTLTDFQSN